MSLKFYSWFIFKSICLIFVLNITLVLSAQAHWSLEKIRDFAIKELAVRLDNDVQLYRWGSAEHELKRTEKVLGRGVPTFDLASVTVDHQLVS